MADESSSDPFRVRLNWPENDLVPAPRRDQQGESDDRRDTTGEPTAIYEPDDVEPSGSVLFTVASRLEGLRAALANVATRLDSLIRREEQFREFTTGRLAENAEQVALAIGSTRTAIEDQARDQRQMIDLLDAVREEIAGLRADVVESVAGLRADLVESVARTEARDEELAEEVGRLAEELRVLRRRVSVRARSGSPRPAADEDEQDFAPPPAPAAAPPQRGRIRRRPPS